MEYNNYNNYGIISITINNHCTDNKYCQCVCHEWIFPWTIWTSGYVLVHVSLDVAGMFPFSSVACNNHCTILQFIRSIIIIIFKDHDVCRLCVMPWRVWQGNNDRAFRDGTWQTGSTVYAEIFVCEIPRGLNFRGFRGWSHPRKFATKILPPARWKDGCWVQEKAMRAWIPRLQRHTGSCC